MWTSVTDLWRSTHPSHRKAALWFVGLGVVLFVVGVALDVRHGWDGLPFTMNVVSTLAGALIGVPLAVLVISDLAARSAEYRSRRRLALLIGRMISRFSLATRSLIVEGKTLDDARQAIDGDLQAAWAIASTNYEQDADKFARSAALAERGWTSAFVDVTELPAVRAEIRHAQGVLSSVEADVYRADLPWIVEEFARTEISLDPPSGEGSKGYGDKLNTAREIVRLIEMAESLNARFPQAYSEYGV